MKHERKRREIKKTQQQSVNTHCSSSKMHAVCENLILLNTEMIKTSVSTKKKSLKFFFPLRPKLQEHSWHHYKSPPCLRAGVSEHWTRATKHQLEGNTNTRQPITQLPSTMWVNILWHYTRTSFCRSSRVQTIAEQTAQPRSEICKCSPKAISFEITSLPKWLLLYERFPQFAYLKLLYSQSYPLVTMKVFNLF